jgi:hypothetical protein
MQRLFIIRKLKAAAEASMLVSSHSSLHTTPAHAKVILKGIRERKAAAAATMTVSSHSSFHTTPVHAKVILNKELKAAAVASMFFW